MLDDQLSLDALHVFVTASRHPSDRILPRKLKESDADRIADILKDLKAVVWRPHVLVEPRSPVGLNPLRLDFVRIKIELRRQRVYSLPSLEIALQGIAIHQVGCLEDPNAPTALSGEAASAVLDRH